jgi:hypothetical protein
MKDLLELEQHVNETNIALSQKNWLKIIPADQFSAAHSKMVEVRKGLLDAVFHSVDIIDAIQWMIDYATEKQPGMSAKSVNPDGLQYNTEHLLKIRLNALYASAPATIVDDIVKYVNLSLDELRQEIAKLMYANNQLKEANKHIGTQRT